VLNVKGYYWIKETNNGWAIFYTDEFSKGKFIANQLSQKQAINWCDRLNEAYNEGFTYGSY
jgi:hypothetical protein